MTSPRCRCTPALALMLLGLTVSPVSAHLSGRTVAQLTLPTAPPAGTPNGVQQQGIYVTAPIVIDGVPIFRIAVPGNTRIAQEPIAVRVTAVQTALAQLLAETGTGPNASTVFDPKTIRVHTRRAGDAVVLEAVDAKHSDPLPIVTVTSVDARANSVEIDALASEWQGLVQTSLVRALMLRQPAAEQRSLRSVAEVGLGLIAVSLLAIALLRTIWRRMADLQAEVSARNAEAQSEATVAPEESGASARRRRFFALRLRALKPAQRLTVFGTVAETILWALAITWFGAATWSLSLFAETTPLAQQIVHSSLEVATTVVFAVLLSRVLDAVIARTAAAWRLRRFTNSDERARSLLRIPTITRTIAGAKTFAVVFIAVLSALGQIGVPIGSVITIGGVTAIALSLAAQNFVRDFLNGFLVLLEDQYVVGDYVTINNFSGIVETLTLRMVQIRDAAGDVVTIPHSSVVNVVNQSRNWSRVDYRVPVDPAADVAAAIDIVRKQVASLASEDDWTHGRGDPIEWIGIDGLSKDWVIIRASVRTAPLRQFELRRQINERVLGAFAKAGIALGAQLPAQ